MHANTFYFLGVLRYLLRLFLVTFLQLLFSFDIFFFIVFSMVIVVIFASFGLLLFFYSSLVLFSMERSAHV